MTYQKTGPGSIQQNWYWLLRRFITSDIFTGACGKGETSNLMVHMLVYPETGKVAQKVSSFDAVFIVHNHNVL